MQHFLRLVTIRRNSKISDISAALALVAEVVIVVLSSRKKYKSRSCCYCRRSNFLGGGGGTRAVGNRTGNGDIERAV